MRAAWLLGVGVVAGLTAGVLAPRSWDGAANAAAIARDFTSSSFVGLTNLINRRNVEASPQRGGNGPAGDRPRGYTPVVSMTVAADAKITRTVDVIGNVRALKSVALTSEATGNVTAVNFKPGQRVSEGDVLVQIDDVEQQVALTRAQAEFPIARENAERYRELSSDAAASALEAEQALNNFTAVRAQLRAAEVAVEQRKIRAPFDGIAGLTEIEAGDYLRAGDPVTTLDDTSAIIVEFSVPQESAAFVNIGQPVSVALTSAANLVYSGEVTAIDSRVNSQSRTLRIEAEVSNKAGRLIPGAVVAISTSSEGEQAIAVPGLSVQWDQRGAFVWRRSGDGAAERIGVIVLQRTEDSVLVDGALNIGDVIVAEGADRVRAGVSLPNSSADLGGAAARLTAASP